MLGLKGNVTCSTKNWDHHFTTSLPNKTSKKYLQVRSTSKAVWLRQKIYIIYTSSQTIRQSHSLCWPLGGTRHGWHSSRAASFALSFTDITTDVGINAKVDAGIGTGLHVASRVGELVVHDSWGKRPVSWGSRSGLRRRTWLWKAGIERGLWRAPLEYRLSQLRITVGVLVWYRVIILGLKKEIVRMTLHSQRNRQTWKGLPSCIILPLRQYLNYRNASFIDDIDFRPHW